MRVEMHQAFWCYCPACAEEITVRPFVPEEGTEAAKRMPPAPEKRETDDTEWVEEGCWMVAPETVECPNCKQPLDCDYSGV